MECVNVFQWGEKDLAMTDRTEKMDASHQPENSAAPAWPKVRPPRRPSYDRVMENIDKWVNSSGLQKPT
jgi:hypothetical protein